jgi:hypothetical protein
VTRLMAPPLPAESRASKMMTSLSFLATTPVLELDQLTLQTQQLLEIKRPRQRIAHLKMFGFRQEVGEFVVFELKLDVLIEIVLDLSVDALLELAHRTLFFRAQFIGAHCSLPWLAPAPRRESGD